MTDRFQVGVIAGTHGLHGEVRVFPTTDHKERFKDLIGKKVYLTGGRQELAVTVSAARGSGQFELVLFREFDSIDDVERLRGRGIEIDRADAVKLPEGSYFIPDLIGMKVLDLDGNEIGTCTDVLQTGANDVYVTTTPEGKELMLPAVSECVREVHPEEGYMKVYVLPGLEDL